MIRIIAAGMCIGVLSADTRGEESGAGRMEMYPEAGALPLENEKSNRWTARLGVGFLTRNDIGELALGNADIANGDAGGTIYTFEIAYRVHRFLWQVDRRIYFPELEVPLELHVYNENGRSPFYDYNAGIRLRWVDFPWDRYMQTTFAMTIGLSYSEKVPAIDHQRHPDRDRSHLKFHWPMEITLAVPRWPDHQLVLFTEHQSGGMGVLDRGGINSLGIGYRLYY